MLNEEGVVEIDSIRSNASGGVRNLGCILVAPVTEAQSACLGDVHVRP